MDAHHLPDSILIVDFGSQVTQLIARRVREAGVYSEIAPFTSAEEAFHRMKPKGIILSGSPASVPEEGSPRAPQVLFDSGLPILGICYGQQVMSQQLGGEVRPGHETGDGGEFGRAFLTVTRNCALFDGLWQEGERHQVWMSHGDKVTQFAPGFEIVAVSDGAPFAVIADESRKYYGTQFHPEVVHTPDGAKLIANFAHKVCGLSGDWTMAEFRATKIAEIRAQVGTGRVICGLSGGVDSSVAAILIHEAIGDQLTCVFVDHGLLRMGEREQVEKMFRDHYNIPLVVVDAEERFMAGLAGVTDPEKKRKFIGA
jgi:GMP synthase (glutamine-hydrolysing)